MVLHNVKVYIHIILLYIYEKKKQKKYICLIYIYNRYGTIKIMIRNYNGTRFNYIFLKPIGELCL